MKVKCEKCGHEWDTKSKHVFVSCPSCLNKVRIKKKSEKYLKKGGVEKMSKMADK